jgi:diguanylate cyclase (GGDEF)-like protein
MNSLVVEKLPIRALPSPNGLDDLRDIADLLAGSIPVVDAFNLAASRVCRYLNGKGATLFILDRERKHLAVGAKWGLTSEQSFWGEIARRCFASKCIELGSIENEGSNPSSVAAVPLDRGMETIAVIIIYFDQPSSDLLALDHILQMVREHVSPVIVRSLIYERNAAKAHIDSISELPNERGFRLACEKAIGAVDPTRLPFSIVVFNISDFSSMRARIGATAGTAVLKQVAEIAQDNLRERDLLAVSENDEFLVLLPSASEGESSKIISRIRNGIAGADLSGQTDRTEGMELNCGYAVYGTDADSPSSLLALARLRKDSSKTRNILIFPQHKNLHPDNHMTAI